MVVMVGLFNQDGDGKRRFCHIFCVFRAMLCRLHARIVGTWTREHHDSLREDEVVVFVITTLLYYAHKTIFEN